MITDPRHRELLQQAIDAQTLVSDELQSAHQARIALPIDDPRRLSATGLYQDLLALELVISGSLELLNQRPQP
jgi:hypothetical protein